jgi:hypothetical protein
MIGNRLPSSPKTFLSLNTLPPSSLLQKICLLFGDKQQLHRRHTDADGQIFDLWL